MNPQLSDTKLERINRARDIGIHFPGKTGPLNAITDVQGVEVGFTTLISGEGALKVGSGPVRTGVTAILTRDKGYDLVFAAWYSLNGNGEMTRTTWTRLDEFGRKQSGWLHKLQSFCK